MASSPGKASELEKQMLVLNMQNELTKRHSSEDQPRFSGDRSRDGSDSDLGHDSKRIRRHSSSMEVRRSRDGDDSGRRCRSLNNDGDGERRIERRKIRSRSCSDEAGRRQGGSRERNGSGGRRSRSLSPRERSSEKGRGDGCFIEGFEEMLGNYKKEQFKMSDANDEGSSDSSSEFPTWGFDQQRSRRDLARLIILSEWPFRIVESHCFKNFMSGLQPLFHSITWKTVRNDCLKIYESEKSELKENLRTSCQRVCLTTDMWTSIQQSGYLCLTAHYIDDEWKLQKKILNFCKVPTRHAGEHLADVIINCLQQWNLEKLCTITMDNCSANDVVAKTLVDHFSSRNSLLLHGQVFHVHCWTHILNLILQEGLDEIKDFITKVRETVKYVKGSQGRKQEFLEFVKQEQIPNTKRLCLDVCTRWNSTYSMLGSALHYKKAFNRLDSGDLNLVDAPTVEDWEKVEAVCQFLEVFLQTTKILYGSHYCTLNLLFHELYGIQLLLLETSRDVNDAMSRMAMKMQHKFENYWKDKEYNLLLSIAIVLDP